MKRRSTAALPRIANTIGFIWIVINNFLANWLIRFRYRTAAPCEQVQLIVNGRQIAFNSYGLQRWMELGEENSRWFDMLAKPEEQEFN